MRAGFWRADGQPAEGASRALRRGVLVSIDWPVSGPALAELAAGCANIQIEVADAGAATAAGFLLDKYEPRNLIIVAGLQKLP